MSLDIRQASSEDTLAVSRVLCDAASWLEKRGMPLWSKSELVPSAIRPDVALGLYYLAFQNGSAVGAFRYQLNDGVHWPDAAPDEASYIHRLAVMRSCSGQSLAPHLLRFAAALAKSHSRPYLRLDCDSARPKLRAVYERFGFVHHSDFQAGSYHVARYQLSVQHVA